MKKVVFNRIQDIQLENKCQMSGCISTQIPPYVAFKQTSLKCDHTGYQVQERVYQERGQLGSTSKSKASRCPWIKWK